MSSLLPGQLIATQIHPTVIDWWHGVERQNTGVTVSEGRINALNNFYSGLSKDGLLPKMKAINCFVPGNLTTATTPLIVGNGSAMWSNSNFTNSDITIHGMRGDGTGTTGTKYLDTGFNPSTNFTAANGGMTVYFQSGSEAGANGGGCPFGSSTNGSTNFCILWVNFDGNSNWCIHDYATSNPTYAGRVFISQGGLSGYISANRISATEQRVFYANSYTSHASIGLNTNAADASLPNVSMTAFCRNEGGSKYSFFNSRISFIAFHDGLTTNESSQFYSLVQRMRQQMGGGYV